MGEGRVHMCTIGSVKISAVFNGKPKTNSEILNFIIFLETIKSTKQFFRIAGKMKHTP